MRVGALVATPAGRAFVKRPRSKWEALLEIHLRERGLRPEVEHGFAQSIGRRWRFDFAFPEEKVGLEVEGGVYSGGRHTRGSGFVGDIEKYNRAALAGWLVLRVTPSMVQSLEAVKLVEEALRLRRAA